MDFVAVVDQVVALPRQRSRVTYRTLKRQFQLDELQGKPVSETIIEAKRSVGILCGQQRLSEEMT